MVGKEDLELPQHRETRNLPHRENTRNLPETKNMILVMCYVAAKLLAFVADFDRWASG